MPHPALAAVMHIPGKPLELQTITLADPGPGEALIRTMSTGICGTDVFFADGRYPYPTPTVLGHEAAGIVQAHGPGTADVHVGDRVIVCDQSFCGRCANCLSGQMVYCTDPSLKQRQRRRIHIDGHPARQYLGVSSFAEFMLVDTANLIPLPAELSFDAGALLSCCVTTGTAAVFNIARPQPGTSIAVIGCGGVGLAAVQAARIAGAAQIIAVDPQPHRRALAHTLGATDVIDPSTTDPVAAVTELSHGGVHRSIEAVGTIATATQAFRMLRPTGHATILGMLPADADLPLPAGLLRHGRSITGTVMGSVRTRHDIPHYAALATSGTLRTDDLVTTHHRLTDINDALDEARHHRGARAVITF
ncbi:zinc-binding dehydrogenase [Actinoplanes sp. ATCC 53533]|uniref:zinc-binding dehydrogenase n=1 Tax=Actinoplanes sp. ATCC 53533 TaxID=1288362 RepID=UPI000F7BA9B4|nr:zinc-binding dehydrogenase [Actinoplanes sp. ATCC 53533]